jgi:hypothetical protein
MEKSKLKKAVGTVPPVPEAVFGRVMDESTTKVWYLPRKSVAALFILAVTTALFLQHRNKHGEEGMTVVHAESVSYIYETYSENYDLLSDL